jgi:membrane protease YdiL (CAAX protease family)
MRRSSILVALIMAAIPWAAMAIQFDTPPCFAMPIAASLLMGVGSFGLIESWKRDENLQDRVQ